jgi:tetratricopeptide (TPR) repeat protein
MWMTLAGVVVAAAGVTLGVLPKEQEWTTASPEALAEFQAGVDAQMKVYEADAARQFERALELDPDFVIANLKSLQYVPHDDSELREARWAKVVAADTSKLTPRERFFVERRIAQHEERSDDADALLDEYVTKYPNDPYILNEKALYTWHAGRMEEAEKLYQRLVEMSPNWVIAYNQLGYIKMSKGQFAEAEEHFKSYRFVAPDQANPHDSLGELFVALGRYAEAEQSFENAIRIKPDFWAAYEHIGLMKSFTGDLEGTREIIARARAAGAPESLVTAFDCHEQYMALYASGAWREILELSQNSKCTEKRDPNFPKIITHLAACEIGDWETADSIERDAFDLLAEVADKAPPKNVDMLRGAIAHMQGVRLAMQGDYPAAEEQLLAADDKLTYIDASAAIFKLYNRMILAELLFADDQDAEAHALLAKVRGVNPAWVAEFEDSGLSLLGLERS